MDKKEIRLNANKRKSLVKDYRRHCEEQDSHEKGVLTITKSMQRYYQIYIRISKEVVERKYELDDVATLRSLQKKYNTVNACGTDSCFYFTVLDAKEVDQYGDEVEKRKHFSFHLDGRYNNGGGYHYQSGSSSSGKNVAYALYREDMKKVGLNPDCNIEADITYDKGTDRYDRRSNPWLSQCRNDNDAWLSGKQGGTNHYQSWEDKHKLSVSWYRWVSFTSHTLY